MGRGFGGRAWTTGSIRPKTLNVRRYSLGSSHTFPFVVVSTNCILSLQSVVHSITAQCSSRQYQQFFTSSLRSDGKADLAFKLGSVSLSLWPYPISFLIDPANTNLKVEIPIQSIPYFQPLLDHLLCDHGRDDTQQKQHVANFNTK